MEGYNTFQERVYLFEEGLQYEPDLVIICFLHNDLEYTSFYTRIGLTPKMQLYPSEYWGLGFKIQKLLAKNSYFFSFLLNRFYRLQNSRLLSYSKIPQTDRYFSHKAVIENNYLGKYPQEVKKLLTERDIKWDKGLAELRKIMGLLRSCEIKALCVYFPYKIQLGNPSLNYPQQILGEFSKEESIRFFDLSPLYTENKNCDILLYDYHPTKLGHRLIADALFWVLITHIFQ